MIHELIDPKKRSNKNSASKHVKTLQESKTAFENSNFEQNDCENKEAESSSATFIPPWLRNSLGLNQRNNLSQATGSSDIKSVKISQRDKELDQHEFEPLKINVGENCCKKERTNYFIPASQDLAQEDNVIKNAVSDNVEPFNYKNNREISVYWNITQRDSETESSGANAETKYSERDELKMTNPDVMTSAEIDKLKEEEKKKLKLMKQKNKFKKRCDEDQKPLVINENSTDFMLEMKAKKDAIKSDIKTEMKNHLKARLTRMNSKCGNLSKTKLSQQEFRLLQEIRNHMGSTEEVDRLLDHVKDINARETIRNSESLPKDGLEKKMEDKEVKSANDVIQKWNDERRSIADKDSLLSTDDENDIKRFSEFLSKNKNLEEKKKCLQEVRNYFERKRKVRMSKRHLPENEKSKLDIEPENKEENVKERLKLREFYKGKKSKFALCDEEIVEKAVDETLQKFVEMYHIHVTPVIMESMKKNILQAMVSDSMENHTKSIDTLSFKRANLEFFNALNKDKKHEKVEMDSFPDSETNDVLNKELIAQRDIKKRNFKILIENTEEQVSKSMKETAFMEDEKLNRLRREFDNFLHSVQNNVDVTNLKLQSIILEKEEQTALSKNLRLVYNFTKKALEPEKTEHQAFKESSDCRYLKDSESQTVSECELIKRNVKVQTFEKKSNFEESSQTENVICVEESTQTNYEEITSPGAKELTSCDISPGLYRMVKSKEAGKFYLYPEKIQGRMQAVSDNIISMAVKAKKINKKKELLNMLARERAKEKRLLFREKEKRKLKESKKILNAALKHGFPENEKSFTKSGNSVCCLYFRDFEENNSESYSSKKDLTDENVSGRLEGSEELGIGDAKEETLKEKNQLEHFWFWDGEKITPGCDLKAHVEGLLKEKLKEMTNAEGRQNECWDSYRDKCQRNEISRKIFDSRNTNALFCFKTVQDSMKGNALVFTDNECIKEINKIKRKYAEDEESRKASMPKSEEKSVRNVATQNSQQTLWSLNISKFKIQSKMSNPSRRTFNKRNIYFKPAHGKKVNLKRADDIIRAFEELKKLKLGLKNTKRRVQNTQTPDSESAADNDTSTSPSKDDADCRLSVIFGNRDTSELEDISSLNLKNKFKKLVSFVDREVQTTKQSESENVKYIQHKVVDAQRHLELIERVLSRVNRKKKEDLWNNIREFIKTKIGRDINCEGAREVCIEIEQDLPESEQGKSRYPVLAKGHYKRHEGDVEVEIDLTLDDLERILHKRQRKIRKRISYGSGKSKKLPSSSSTQSDFNKEEICRYRKHLPKFAALRESRAHDEDMKSFLEK